MAVCIVCLVSIACVGMRGGVFGLSLSLSACLMLMGDSVIDCVVSACGGTLCDGGASSCPAPAPPIMVAESVR